MKYRTMLFAVISTLLIGCQENTPVNPDIHNHETTVLNKTLQDPSGEVVLKGTLPWINPEGEKTEYAIDGKAMYHLSDVAALRDNMVELTFKVDAQLRPLTVDADPIVIYTKSVDEVILNAKGIASVTKEYPLDQSISLCLSFTVSKGGVSLDQMWIDRSF